MSAEKKFITRWSLDFQGNLHEDPNGSWVLAADAAIRDKRLTEKIDALQALLTAADERVDVLEELLRLAREFVNNGVELGYITMPDPETPDAAHDLVPKIDAALKPAEAARCANCDRATVEQCEDAGCGFLGAGNGAPE